VRGVEGGEAAPTGLFSALPFRVSRFSFISSIVC
jgi:hypothetical protein